MTLNEKKPSSVPVRLHAKSIAETVCKYVTWSNRHKNRPATYKKHTENE